MARAAKRAAGRKRRSAALGVLAAAAVPLIALPVSGLAAAGAADFDYFPTEPTRVLTLSLLPGGNDDDLSGVMCQSPRACVSVVYSRANQTTAVAKLDGVVRDGTTGPQIIFAYSQGARVAAGWIRQHAGTEGAPTPADLSFVLMGNPGRKYGGSDRSWEATFPETDYRVIDVSQEYDLASDFPDDRRNLLAMMNANMAFFTTHQNYETVDIYSEANYVWTEGNTTYVFIPTNNLPLLEPLRWFGLGELADSLNQPLKEIIDRAYDRSYLPAQPGLPPTTEPEPEEPHEVTDSRQTAQVQLTSARTVTADDRTDGETEPELDEATLEDDLAEDEADGDTTSGGSEVDDEAGHDDVDLDVDLDLDLDVDEGDSADEADADADADAGTADGDSSGTKGGEVKRAGTPNGSDNGSDRSAAGNGDSTDNDD